MSNSSQIKWATAFIAVMLCVAFSIGQTPPAQPASGNADGPSKAQTDLVVVADFEETPEAVIRGASVTPEVAGEVEYVEGVEGKAVVVGVQQADKPQDMALRYTLADADVIDWKQGTINLWACPQDWDGDDAEFHLLFEGIGEDARLLIYKYVKTDELYFLLGPNSRDAEGKWRWTIAKTSIKDWRRDQWRMVTCTWNARVGMRLFLNGRLVANLPIRELPANPCTRIAVGGFWPAKWEGAQGRTAVDQLQIWNRSLSPTQITKLYRDGKDAMKADDAASE